MSNPESSNTASATRSLVSTGLKLPEETILGLKSMSLNIRRETGAKVSSSALVRAALTALVAVNLPTEALLSEAALTAFLVERLKPSTAG